MTMPFRAAGALVASTAIAAFGITGVAAASTGTPTVAAKTFQQTYPRAAQLCAELAKGTAPKALQTKSAVPATAACTLLQNEFNTAHTAVVASQATLASQRAAALSSTAVACAGPLDGKPACNSTRHANHKAIAALEVQRVQLVRSYVQTTETNRRAFWATIGALPGGATLDGAA